MPTYETPGVYYERIDAAGPAIAAIRTDIAGIVGIAARGPLDTPVPIQSWRQFQAHFGGLTGAGFLAYAVRAFFENGGRRCWVVRVASREPGVGAATAGVNLLGRSGLPAWRIAASSPGAWGNGLAVTVTETHRAQTRSVPARSTPLAAAVDSVAGFGRGTMVQVSQPPLRVWKVVSDVDPIAGRLVWVHAEPTARLPYDAPLTGVDPTRPVEIDSVEYTLTIRQPDGATVLATGLSLIPEHDRYGPRLLAPPVPRPDVDGRAVFPAAPPPIAVEELRSTSRIEPLAPVPAGQPTARPLTGGADGLAALTVFDFIGEPISPLESDTAQARKRRGLRSLEAIGEVAIVAIPDIHVQPVPTPEIAPRPVCVPDPGLPNQPPPLAPAPPPTTGELPPVFSDDDVFRVESALIAHCEALRNRVALLDPPATAALAAERAVAEIRAWRSRFDSSYAALYVPWVRVLDPLSPATAPTRAIPPSGHVAGQFARTDVDIGVHKAPANAPLAMAQDVTVAIDDAVHGLLNHLGVNVIRAYPGRGIRIAGARTIGSDPRWRYVNVRRLLLMIAQAIDRSTQWAVFEPNDGATRAKLRLALTSFLVALWQQGALVGATPREAFFVRCDDETNPPFERALGKLVAEVGVAPSQPFEFIVVRVGRTRDEFEIAEDRGSFALGVA